MTIALSIAVLVLAAGFVFLFFALAKLTHHQTRLANTSLAIFQKQAAFNLQIATELEYVAAVMLGPDASPFTTPSSPPPSA